MAAAPNLKPDSNDPERPYRRWPAAVKEAAYRIGDELHGDDLKTTARLKHELGVDVPRSTVRRWLDLRSKPEAPTVRGLADSALRLVSDELHRMERLPSSKRDLKRLSEVAAILKTLDALRPARSEATNKRSLTDLSAAPSQAAEAALPGQSYDSASLAGLDELSEASDPPLA